MTFSDLKELYPPDWKEISTRIRERDNYTCTECGKKYPAKCKWLHVHHIVPLSAGGNNEDYNLTTLCYKCHAEHHPHMNYNKTKKKRKFSKPFVL